LLDKLGDFKLLDLLGEGGMGTVYRARQESLGREVAVKILPEQLTRSPRFVQRFYREARSAAALVHPNIIQIFSLGQDEDAGLHYYAMEHIRGKDLSQIMKSGVEFSVEQTVTILIQAAEAPGVFRLQRATRGLIKLFSSTGRRVPAAAAREAADRLARFLIV